MSRRFGNIGNIDISRLLLFDGNSRGLKYYKNLLIFGLIAYFSLYNYSFSSQNRIALVIGNSAYSYAQRLSNPSNDAEAIASALRRIGFNVIYGIDLDYFEMQSILEKFSDAIYDADTALFFYAGHGIQTDGRNYLIPVDAKLRRWSDLRFRAVDIDVFLDEMRETDVDILFLDACRDNPFDIAFERGGNRSVTPARGLAEITDPKGSFIAFATEPGNVALDGKGKHSPFTESLLRHIETPNLEIGAMMARVRVDVLKMTDGKQHPWSSSSLVGEYFLAPSDLVESTDVAAIAGQTGRDLDGYSAQVIELEFWRSINVLDTEDAYSTYLGIYPQGVFAPIANLRLKEIRNSPERQGQYSKAPASSDEGASRAEHVPDLEAPVAGSSLAGGVEDTLSKTSTDKLVSNIDTYVGEEKNSPAVKENNSSKKSEILPSEELEKAVESGLGLSRSDRKEVQRRLTLIGFNTRGVDGVFGPNTRKALSEWQKSAGLGTNGYLNEESYAQLMRDSEGPFASWKRKLARMKAAAKEAARKRDVAKAERASLESQINELQRAEQERKVEQAQRPELAAQEKEAEIERHNNLATPAQATPKSTQPDPVRPSFIESMTAGDRGGGGGL